MMFPLVRDLAAEGIPVRLTCGVLGFSPQAFYKWRARPVCDRDWHDAHLTNAIVDVDADDPEFGYRFIADELAQSGHRVGERRVWRLCRRHRVWSTTTRKGRRGRGRQRGHGVVLLAAAEERPRPSPLAQPQRALLRGHRLDRTHLQPATLATRPGQADPRRVRARLHPTALPRGQRGGMISHNHR